MDSSKLAAVDLITREAELQALAEKLGRVDTVAVDTESNSLYAYRERVCLIQFSTDQEDFLVDPLSVHDLSAIGPLFENERIEKIFHAAEYDLLCLRRDFAFEVQNLFDTMIAARILGRNEIGLGALLEAEFGVRLNKRYQRANWGQRPLPNDLLDYARLDTHYLIALKERLKTDLERRKLTALAQEDFRRLANSTLDESAIEPAAERPLDCWRISGVRDLSPQQAAVLQELCHYREEIARQLDRPRFKVMNDQTLLAIAAETPNTLEALGHLPGMSGGQIRRHGRQLLQAVKRGLEAAPAYPTRHARPDPAYSERLEALRSWRKKAGLQMKVPSDVVLPKDLMFALAQTAPHSRGELELAMQSAPWRLEHFGEAILKTLNGNRAS